MKKFGKGIVRLNSNNSTESRVAISFKAYSSIVMKTCLRLIRFKGLFPLTIPQFTAMALETSFLCTVSEAKIRKALNPYMKELSLEPAYLVSWPRILAYSPEKRVVPRMQVLKILDEKKLDRNK
ncbi:hypothetical protein K7X08_002257 [Anisodus acutangulus]|uniref:Uncharacterized protein n=1 Tax=Anisodus acutangulus TaxID=402998 RepID=A0A9Q1LRI0_9SOLA|nr:hypothetical protein K7X08_002257 [Anisodus acutangulus]